MSKLLWTPPQKFIETSNLSLYQFFLSTNYGLTFKDYTALWEWSVKDTALFWESILKYFNIHYTGSYQEVKSKLPWPIQHRWFDGIQVNYAEHILQHKGKDIAILFGNEQGKTQQISFESLYQRVAGVVAFLKTQGIRQGDVVAAYINNIPEAIIAFLACNSIGAVWTSCSPDFGENSVIERLEQVAPKLIFTSFHYQYNGKIIDKQIAIENIVETLPSVQMVVSIQSIPLKTTKQQFFWESIPHSTSPIVFNRVPFNEPIWVLYSSGTTGKPKAITHSVGGILLEHFKALALHQNVKANEQFLWYSTTGWMMWNYANAALLCKATVVVYDGAPMYPQKDSLWRFVHHHEIQHFGAGAAYFEACKQHAINLTQYNFKQLNAIGATGSPLTAEIFDWLYTQVKNDLWVISLSGGTDVCSGMVGGVPTLPVYMGEIQQRMLGVDLHAYSDQGEKLVNELGELVILQAMPSMPIYFWNDTKQHKYFEAYFDFFPGIWRHGDWIKINSHGGVVIYGRSDSTLNRGGVRIGTAEIYNAILNIPEILDALVICVDYPDGKQWMPLFVVVNEKSSLTAELVNSIKVKIKQAYSPRHVPDVIIPVKDIPYTLSGKKMETVVKKIFMGKNISSTVSKDAMKNPETIVDFIEIYQKIKTIGKS